MLPTPDLTMDLNMAPITTKKNQKESAMLTNQCCSIPDFKNICEEFDPTIDIIYFINISSTHGHVQ